VDRPSASHATHRNPHRADPLREPTSSVRRSEFAARALKRRVMIVEASSSEMSRYLRHTPLIVETTVDGRRALDAMRFRPPDVVIFDPLSLGMPADQFMASMRQDPRLGSVPVVLVSASPCLGTLVGKLGGRAGLVQPCDLDVLYAVITRVAGS
jgi:CheY-like chemotaxis protein